MTQLPSQPVTLNIDQISELNEKLAALRHDVNNHLTLIVSSMELIRCRPAEAERFLNMMAGQPARISESIRQFSGALESALKIQRA